MTLDPDGSVELAVIERSGFAESRHSGAAVVVGPDGAVLTELGNGSAHVFGRSTLKFMQAIAVLRSGAELDGVQLVLAAASHRGTPRHVGVVHGILARAGLSENALQCPADRPLDPAFRASEPSRITMNCSGKHAAFLLACVHNGWPVESYLEPGHPLQQLIRATVEEYTGEPIGAAGIDGCGAPVFAVTLRGLARATSRVATDPEAARLVAAIRADAWALDSLAVAAAIDELGIIAKNGAEGVLVAAAPDGTAVALKVLDGSTRASIPVALTLLTATGALDAAAAQRIIGATTERVLGGGVPVGELRVVVG
ncbi:MAG: Asparaginase [Rhodoglobus sp.]|nr:Asparaginase [Rhodoglobus sp.]